MTGQYTLVFGNPEEFEALDMSTNLELQMFGAFHLNGGSEKVLIIDIDDTLRSSKGRAHLIPSKEKIAAAGKSPNAAWTEFNEACGGDEPITENIELVKGLIKEYPESLVLFLTSCTATAETIQATLQLLKDCKFKDVAAMEDFLIMRGEDNQESPLDFKRNFVLGTKLDQYHDERVICVDDNKDIVNMFLQFGFETIKV